jgi:hypothetical protein
VRAALCGGSALYVNIYTKLLKIYIFYCCTLYTNKNKKNSKATNPLGQPYEHLVRVIKMN